MAFRKSLVSNQKSKSKGLSLPKCFQLSGITKTLFPCKSTPHHNVDNYVIMDYTNKTASSDFSTAPATSTMIEARDNQESVHRHHLSNYPNRQNEYYVLNQEQEYHYNNGAFSDVEETPRSAFSVSSITSYISDYDDVTIVDNNKSPISNNRTMQSNDSFTECLHSTKLSNDNIMSSSIMPDSLSPLSNNKQSTLLHSPISTGQSISDNTSNYLELSSQLESLILGLSSISVQGVDTHVCTQNYDATFVDDVTVTFADTMKVLRDNNDDWLYVEISSDGRKGFVPRGIVSDLKDFIEQLKEHQTLISQSSLINSQL